MRFSQRKKLLPVREAIQRDGLDPPLLNKLWSVVFAEFFDPVMGGHWTGLGDPQAGMLKEIWRDFFAYPMDEMPGAWDEARAFIKKWFFNDARWFEVLDFVEYLVQLAPSFLSQKLASGANRALVEEVSAYRVVGTEIAELTDEQEIAAIESALADARTLPDVEEHLEAALEKYADRKSPDYRNSVKESISAVEALCQRITGDRNASLGQALKSLEISGVSLHPALKGAWEKLYGYTSQSGGIRHALSDAVSVDGGEAKYMLVSSAAFVHYLIELAQKAGVSLE